MAMVDVAEIHARHDRRVPGTRANIDLLVIGPAGVFVIDAKLHEGQIHIRGVDVEFSWSSAACRSPSGSARGLRGKPVVRREGDASLFAFEKTSTLVTTGIR